MLNQLETQVYQIKWKLKSTSTKSNGNSLELDLKIVFQVAPSLGGGPLANPTWTLCGCLFFWGDRVPQHGGFPFGVPLTPTKKGYPPKKRPEPCGSGAWSTPLRAGGAPAGRPAPRAGREALT